MKRSKTIWNEYLIYLNEIKYYFLGFVFFFALVIILSIIPVYLPNKSLSIDVDNVYENDFELNWIRGSPDGYSREILSINGKFPGETIFVHRGDSIRIRIRNQMNESTTIHWHGFYQRNSLEMDGVPGLTQCEILPNDSYEYLFSTGNQSGTFWYHSHSVMHYGDGLKGVIVVRDRDDPWKDFYDKDEDILQLSDWYHQSVSIYLKEYLYPGMLDPVPDSALINGIGQFQCSLTFNCSFHRIFIRRGERKRLRLINTSVYARFSLTISNHLMRLIEVDGILLDGNSYLQTIRLSPGQRYSVIIQGLNNPTSISYWINAQIHPFVDYNHQYNYSLQSNVYSILSYEDSHHSNSYPSIESLVDQQILLNQSIYQGETFFDHLNLIPHSSLNLSSKSFENRSKREILYNSQHKGVNPGYFHFNNETFVHPKNETLLSMVIHSNSSSSSSSSLSWPTLISIESDDIVEILLNNIDFASHPFHLHGHHFWIIGQGSTDDLYRNFSSTNINRIEPIYRDTITINPFSYAFIRFHADNPGIWMMHCHNDWHVQLGMAVVFLESQTSIRHFYRTSKSFHQIPQQCSHH